MNRGRSGVGVKRAVGTVVLSILIIIMTHLNMLIALAVMHSPVFIFNSRLEFES